MSLFRWRNRDEELVDEIETHLSLAEDEYRRAGLAEADARAAAQRAFGGVLKARQVYREQHQSRHVTALMHEAPAAARRVARNPLYAFAPVLVLGLGIGANHIIFTLGYSHTLRGLPITNADRVLMASLAEGSNDRQLSWVELSDLRAGATLFDDVAALGATVAVSVGDAGRSPDRYQATYLTANAFDVIGVRPTHGRTFTQEEERGGSANVAVLGSALWKARYGSDPSIVGRDILLNGDPTTIVGILPEKSGLPTPAEVWLPIAHAPGFSATDRSVRTLRAFGRVREGTSVDAARAQLETLLTEAARLSPATQRFQPSVGPINRRFFGTPTEGVWLAFFTAGLLVVLVSSANVANMMLGRGVQRAREMAIRTSLGATRARVFCQLILESTAIAAAAALIGVVLSVLGVRAFSAQIPPDVLPYWLHYSLNATVFAVLVVIAFGTVLIFGLLPALQVSKVDVIRVLRDGGWGGSNRDTSQRWTTAFTAVQIGLAMVLLAYGVTNSLETDAPPPSDAVISAPDVLTASVALSGSRYATPEQRNEFFRVMRERVRATTGVTAVTLTGAIPRSGALEQRLQLTPGDDVAPEQLPTVATVSVGPAYFATLRVPIVHGREFEDRDAAADPAAIVNQRFVSRFSREEDAIGRHIALVNPATKATRTFRIVGVAEDIRHRAAVEPVVYLPLSVVAPTTAFVLVRNELDPATMTAQLREVTLGVDPHLPVFNARTLARAVHDAGWNGRISARLVNTLTLIMLVLAAVGLSATATQSVYQRTKEIGIRVAVGARPAAVRWLILKRSAVQVTLGLGFGLLCTTAWDAVFFSGSSTARFISPEVLLPIVGILLGIMTVACFVPVRRAVRLDPLVALRQD